MDATRSERNVKRARQIVDLASVVSGCIRTNYTSPKATVAHAATRSYLRPAVAGSIARLKATRVDFRHWPIGITLANQIRSNTLPPVKALSVTEASRDLSAVLDSMERRRKRACSSGGRPIARLVARHQSRPDEAHRGADGRRHLHLVLDGAPRLSADLFDLAGAGGRASDTWDAAEFVERIVPRNRECDLDLPLYPKL
jgi:antitoxin (DNA-binding transcriptional repressor) of toxin-antitoxin stability system